MGKKKGGNKFRGGMGELMRQASRMQRKIEARKEELKEETVDASAGNDKVKAVANGGGELVSVTIDPELLKEEELEPCRYCNKPLRFHTDLTIHHVHDGECPLSGDYFNVSNWPKVKKSERTSFVDTVKKTNEREPGAS